MYLDGIIKELERKCDLLILSNFDPKTMTIKFIVKDLYSDISTIVKVDYPITEPTISKLHEAKDLIVKARNNSQKIHPL